MAWRSTMKILDSLFSSGDFMPHGYCYLWKPGLVWLHVVSDALIALAYFSIPITLIYFIRKRRDLPFNWMFLCFGTFIMACGTTHAMEVWTLWHGTYWLSGAIKAVTAMASVPTAILLVHLVPRALALPSPEAMKLEIAERKRAQQALHEAKEELELRVRERTAELSKANEELVAENAQRKRVEKESVAWKDELAAELMAMSRLHEFSTRLLSKAGLLPLLEEILNAIIALQNADFGNVQLYNPETKTLEIVAHRGFQRNFLDYFSSVNEPGAACGRAMQRRERVIIEDVLADPDFEPHRQIAASAGFRAVQSTPLFSRSGEPLGVISTHFRRPHRPSGHDLRFTDFYARLAAELIERQRAEEALRRSEARFRNYFELGLIGMAMTSPTKGNMEVNDELGRILGYSRQELLQKTWAEMTHPDDLAADIAQFNRVMAGELDGYTLDKRWIRKDGRIIDSIKAAKCLRRADGSVDYFVGLVLDTTERKQAEEKLRRSEAHLAEAQRIGHVGSWIWNVPTGECLWSQEHFRIFGLDPDTFKPTKENTQRLIHPEDLPLVEQTLERAIREQSNFEVDYRLIRPDGAVRYHHGIGRPVEKPQGEPEFIGMVVDVTERREAEEALQKLQTELAHLTRVTAMGELAASIAHEINQPLGAIINNCNACLRLLRKPRAQKQIRDVLADVVKDANRSSAIIARIRSLTKPSAPEKTSLQPEHLVTDVLALARLEIEARRIIIQIDLAQDPPPISGA